MYNLSEKPTVIVADDHPLLLKGLVEELQSKTYKVVGQAKNGLEALNLIIKSNPDIAILDVEMPLFTGIEVIQKAKENGTLTKFIILTSHKEQGIVSKAQSLHIDGYLLKDEPFEELEKCIQAIVNGQSYFSKTFTTVLEEEVNPKLKKLKFLTPSERTILRLITQQHSSKVIADKLSISIRTVEKHRSNIIDKLGLPSSGEALLSWTKEHKALILNI